MSIVVGIALNFNAYGSFREIKNGNSWKIARFFIIPFCVSSYPLLIKDQNFFLIFSPKVIENVVALIPTALLLIFTFLMKKSNYLVSNPEDPNQMN